MWGHMTGCSPQHCHRGATPRSAASQANSRLEVHLHARNACTQHACPMAWYLCECTGSEYVTHRGATPKVTASQANACLAVHLHACDACT